jgi:hypothetical protein
MPMDSLMWNNADFKRRCIGWKLKYSIWPRRCHYTNKLLWFTLAYHGVGMICGPGEPVFEDRWCNRQEYLFLKIKGSI